MKKCLHKSQTQGSKYQVCDSFDSYHNLKAGSRQGFPVQF